MVEGSWARTWPLRCQDSAAAVVADSGGVFGRRRFRTAAFLDGGGVCRRTVEGKTAGLLHQSGGSYSQTVEGDAQRRAVAATVEGGVV